MFDEGLRNLAIDYYLPMLRVAAGVGPMKMPKVLEIEFIIATGDSYDQRWHIDHSFSKESASMLLYGCAGSITRILKCSHNVAEMRAMVAAIKKTYGEDLTGIGGTVEDYTDAFLARPRFDRGQCLFIFPFTTHQGLRLSPRPSFGFRTGLFLAAAFDNRGTGRIHPALDLPFICDIDSPPGTDVNSRELQKRRDVPPGVGVGIAPLYVRSKGAGGARKKKIVEEHEPTSRVLGVQGGPPHTFHPGFGRW